MTNKKSRPMFKKENFVGCPMIIETAEREYKEPGICSKAQKGNFKIISGPEETYIAENVTCIRDDKGNVSYETEKTPETKQSHDVRS